MKVKVKKVYYCDYCKKRSLRSLSKHEKHCTANPDRECRLCGRESVRDIIEKYKKLFTIEQTETVELCGQEWEVVIKPTFKKPFTLKDIINELDYFCPNCLLAIIRCVGLNRYYFEGKFKFDYQKMLDNWWRESNRADREEEERQSYYDY